MIENKYNIRNLIVKNLGFNSYAEYLKSELWSKIRIRAYAANNSKCKLCGSRAKCIHHRDYTEDVLTGKDITPLAPLCMECHNKIELDDNRVKRTYEDTEKMFVQLLHKYTGPTKSKKIQVPGICLVCDKKVKEGSRFCKRHRGKLLPIEPPREGEKGCKQCGMRKRSGRTYCSRCWDKETGRLRGQ